MPYLSVQGSAEVEKKADMVSLRLRGVTLQVVLPEKKEKAGAAPEYRLAPVRFSQGIHAIFLISPAK